MTAEMFQIRYIKQRTHFWLHWIFKQSINTIFS